MKKIYLMGLSAMFAFAVNAQTTIRVKNPLRGEGKNNTSTTAKVAQVGCVITCNTQYVAGTTMDLDLTYQTSNTDLEYVDFLEITLPAGITPTGLANTSNPFPNTEDNAGGLEALNLPVVGQVISWGANTDDTYGGIFSTAGINFTINVTVAPGTTGNLTANYLASGDGYGASPGDFNGSFIIYPAGAAIVNITTNAIGVLTSPTTVADAHNCSMGTHTVACQIKNIGTNAESNIPVNYSVNGVPSTPVVYPSLAAGDSALILFPTTYNFSAQNIYNVKAWTSQLGDVAAANDTVVATLSNSLPVALTNTANVYTNGVETAYEVGSVNLDWIGTGASFGLSTANFHSGARAYFLTLPGASVPVGTYESYVNLPCVDITIGDTYRISYWRKCSASGTLTVNGQTGVFSGLAQDAASMTDVVKPYSAMTPTLASGINGWQKDSVDYVATATETRYFAVAGKGVINGTSDQINVRLDDFKIWKVAGPVGIKTIATNDAIAIFPNPTSGILNINAIEANSSVEVINIIGEKVYTSTLVKGNNSIDLSSLANGAYFVKLNSNNQIITKKVVLSK